MTNHEAAEWLRQVDGRLFRTPEKEDGAQAWVAMVRTPRAGLESGKLIIALGASMLEATTAAATQWQTQWNRLSDFH